MCKNGLSLERGIGMKKAMLVLAVATTLTLTMPIQGMQNIPSVAMAKSTAPSLDEIGSETDSSGDLGLELDGSEDSLSQALDEAADMGDVTPQAQKVGAAMTKVCTIAVQIISYVITLGLVLTTGLDLAFIAVPILQDSLSGGAVGMGPQQGQQGMQQGGMGGMSGGMGGYGMSNGMGGMGSYGMSGGMGGYGMSNGMGGMQAQQGMQAGGMPGAGRCYVSKAALNAVAMDGQPGPTGKPSSAIRIYAKEMAVKIAGTGILTVLLISGVLTQLGVVAGSALANAIGSIRGMF